MQSPIELMYQAAKVDIPAEAEHVARIANKLEGALSTLNVESSRAGDPALLTSMLHVGGDMLVVLGKAVTTMDNCAVAVKLTADDYVATDDQAATDYDNMNDRLKNQAMPPKHETTPLPTPEAPGYESESPGPLPGQSTHVDPSEDPTPPSEDADERGDGSEDQPGVPEVDRDWN